MNFKIEVRKQEGLGELDQDTKGTDEAIWDTYPNYDYEFVLFLIGFTINLDYRGDLTSIYKDLIKILKKLKSGESDFSASFLSSTFMAKFNFKVNNDQLLMTPRWTDVDMYDREGKKVESVNFRDYEQVQVFDKNSFLNEWDYFLLDVARDLKKVGYDENLEDFDYLADLLKKYGE